MGEGIIFVIVTLGAFDGYAQDAFAIGLCLIDEVFDAVFFRDDPTFSRKTALAEQKLFWSVSVVKTTTTPRPDQLA